MEVKPEVVDGDPVQTQEEVKEQSPLQVALKALADRERATHGLEVGDFLVASRALDDAIKAFIGFTVKAAHGDVPAPLLVLIGSVLTNRINGSVYDLYTAAAQLKYGPVSEHEAEVKSFIDLQNASRKEWAETLSSFETAANDSGVSGVEVPDGADETEGAPSIVLP
jgi:hypothetical protein